MKHFDVKLGKWCKNRHITYTRYRDDMTFSGNRTTLRKSNIIVKVKALLNNMGMKLNDKKTIFISSSQQQRVTGIVVNEKPAIPREMRRSIRQEVYYSRNSELQTAYNDRDLIFLLTSIFTLFSDESHLHCKLILITARCKSILIQ